MFLDLTAIVQSFARNCLNYRYQKISILSLKNLHIFENTELQISLREKLNSSLTL